MERSLTACDQDWQTFVKATTSNLEIIEQYDYRSLEKLVRSVEITTADGHYHSPSVSSIEERQKPGASKQLAVLNISFGVLFDVCKFYMKAELQDGRYVYQIRQIVTIDYQGHVEQYSEFELFVSGLTGIKEVRHVKLY